MDESPEIQKLRQRLGDQERAYAQLLAAVEAVGRFPLPSENRPELVKELEALGRSGGASAAAAQVLKQHLEETDRFYSQLRELMAAVVRHLQSVLPVMQARDRVAMEMAASRCELILRSFEDRAAKTHE